MLQSRERGPRQRALLWPGVLWACLAAPPQAGAVTLDAGVLAAIAPGVASAAYTSADAPGVVLRLDEDGSATLRGSDLFGYEGLWIGSDGSGGSYTLRLNQPVSSLSLWFTALSAFPGGPAETLAGFSSDAATSASLDNDDGSASWAGGVLRPLDEDARGRLTFTAAAATGFSSLRFTHLQDTDQQGFVVSQIDYALAAVVPEPHAAALLAAGLLLLAAGSTRGRAAAPVERLA